MIALSEIFVRYGTALSAVVFVGFFAMWAVALLGRDHERFRRSYVAGFLCVVLLVSALTGLQPIPIVNVNEYSTVSPERYVHYDLRVVDDDGAELPYDPRAMRPNLQNEELAENMGKIDIGSEKTQIAYTPTQRREMAAFLLREAREHRRRVATNGDPLRVLRVPPHHLRNRLFTKADSYWTAGQLEEYSRFAGIRIYRMEVTFTDGGGQAVVEDQRVVYEYRPGGNETS